MSNLFLSFDGESYSLTTPGYVLIAILIFAVLVLISAIVGNGKKIGAKPLVFSAAALGLAVVTSMIKVLEMPMGGSITLCSMLFVVLIGYWYGSTVGLMAGIAYGLLQFILDPYILSLPQVLVDYIFAFGALGLSGFFSGKKNGLILGFIAAVLGRFVFAVLSGVIFFGQYAPENMSPLVYSVSYNGAYLGAEAVLTIVILLIPAVRKAMDHVKRLATE